MGVMIAPFPLCAESALSHPEAARRYGPIVLQNDFGSWSEENFFQIKAE
jgi:hypothetical protein